MKFEEFLREKHAEQYHGFDDEMPDNCEEWITDLGIDELIGYAEKWHAQELPGVNELVEIMTDEEVRITTTEGRDVTRVELAQAIAARLEGK